MEFYIFLVALPLVGGLALLYWLYRSYMTRFERSQAINDDYDRLRSAVELLRVMRMEGRVPAAWKETVRRTLESVDLVQRDFIGLDLYRKDPERMRIVKSVKDLEQEVQSILARIKQGAEERRRAEQNAADLLARIPKRFAHLEGKAQSPKARRLYDDARAQYVEARKKVDDGGDIDWLLLYMLLQSSDQSSREAERMVASDERDGRTDASESRDDRGSSSHIDQSSSYRSDDGPTHRSHDYADSRSHDNHSHSDHSSHTSDHSSGDSGGSSGGDSGGGGGSD